jgi:hypothetical protein
MGQNLTVVPFAVRMAGGGWTTRLPKFRLRTSLQVSGSIGRVHRCFACPKSFASYQEGDDFALKVKGGVGKPTSPRNV